MDSRRLRHFLAVYEHGTLGRAAAAIHVTQPALSKSIRQLEQELNVKLFERTPSGVVATLHGHTLSLHAKMIEAEMHNAEREIASLSGATKGSVTVGVTPSIAADLLPTTFLRLRAERPGITLKMQEGLMEQHIPALRRGELDVVIGGWFRGMHPDLVTEIVRRDEVLVFAGAHHPLVGQAPLALATLLEFPWVLPPQTQFWLDSFEKAFVGKGLPPPLPEAVTNSASFIKAMLQRYDCLSALPSQLLVAECRAGAIVPLRLTPLNIDIDITATYRKRAIQPAVFNAFMQALKGVCQPAGGLIVESAEPEKHKHAPPRGRAPTH
jgi:DNA-binding transcriptional LysR family regulator